MASMSFLTRSKKSGATVDRSFAACSGDRVVPPSTLATSTFDIALKPFDFALRPLLTSFMILLLAVRPDAQLEDLPSRQVDSPGGSPSRVMVVAGRPLRPVTPLFAALGML
jgi:hypothetical protein